jgi:hypothetical protein
VKNLRISIGWFLLSLVSLSLFLKELEDSFNTDSTLIYKAVLTALCFSCIVPVVGASQMVMDSWKESRK